jgi:hypothetical protein
MPSAPRQIALSVLTKVLARKVEWLLALSAPTLVAATEAAQSYLVQLVPSPPEIWAVRSIAISMSAMLVAALSYVYHKPKFVHDPLTGTYIDIKTRAHFCASCKHTKKETVPLGIIAHGWKCPACGSKFDDPSRPRPPIEAPEWKPLDPSMGY